MERNNSLISSNSPKDRNIQELRGMAVAMVFIGHLNNFLLDRKLFSELDPILEAIFHLDLGKLGVLLFFLVSGYVIPGSTNASGFDAAIKFAGRRWHRIYPLLTFAILVNFIFIYPGEYSERIPLAMSNYFLVGNFFYGAHHPGELWTLQVEACFYFLIFLSILLRSTNRVGGWTSLLLISCALGGEFLRGSRALFTLKLQRFLGC